VIAFDDPDGLSLFLQWLIAIVFGAIVLTWLWRFIRSERRRRGR